MNASNITPHPDAREARCKFEPLGARAGGRGRYVADHDAGE